MIFIGELAGLSTALLWALTSVFFSESGRRIGSLTTNLIRLVMAVLMYACLSFFTTGYIYPHGVNQWQYFWLGLSGLVGLVIGDGCGFKALVMIGPRLTTLVYSSTPIVTTIIAWIFLGEQLSLIDILGISITISGISWVVLERRFKNVNHFNLSRDHPDSGSLVKGVLLAVGAAIGQATGLVLAKQGMSFAGGAVEPLTASYVRMVVALAGLGAVFAARGLLPNIIKSLRDGRALSFCAAGAVVGPFLGVWMSLVAIKYIAAGLAATLNSTTPVMILPLVFLWYKEKISPRAVLGAIVTVCGVAIIFLF